MTGSPSSAASPAPGLRERRRRETRRELAAAALELFEQKGLHHTTTDEIAEAAGISSRTFFRYAETKEHALFADDDGFDILVARVRDALARGVDVISAIEQAHLDLLDDFDREPADRQSRVLRVRRLVIAEPSLLALALASDAEHARVLLELVLTANAAISEFEARTVLTAMGTTLRLSFDEWVISAERGERVSVRSMYERVLTRLRTYFAG
ncbi:TetR family transcriptional regulator [Microbacterium sp. NPDC058345]|uniref:TetR family transcriptional regulator n=1 Tax=Microbacterium sp. NPDC058345 TaxID=3346455 RepID=UPI003650CC0D